MHVLLTVKREFWCTKNELEQALCESEVVDYYTLLNPLRFLPERYKNVGLEYPFPDSYPARLCYEDVKRADYILVNGQRHDGLEDKLSIGTMMEVAWAMQLGKILVFANAPERLVRHDFFEGYPTKYFAKDLQEALEWIVEGKLIWPYCEDAAEPVEADDRITNREFGVHEE